MANKFQEYKTLDLPKLNKEVLARWRKEKTFEKSLEIRIGHPEFIFFEGPPSANGIPGIHHVMARTLKDIFCRYKTHKGFLVKRKAGWDTHGLPIELGVENLLGITKEDIGKKISIKEYNDTCKREVMKYTQEWEDLTEKMGYWVNMNDPYITCDNRYIETLWYLLKQLHNKDLLYKGYTIQPYSPAAGTGLSSHELNQPGCYRDIKDTTVIALFEVVRDKTSDFLFNLTSSQVYILAWTTTPWTLPSNTALAMGPDIDYVLVETINPYSGEAITVVLAKALFRSFFPEKSDHAETKTDKKIPSKILGEFKGSRFEGIGYKQLIDWVTPMGKAFQVLLGDFVTTEEGTGIVHIAPTFGADDYKIAQQYGISPVMIIDKEKNLQPLVDKKGRFFPVEDMDKSFVNKYVNLESYREFAGKYVKNEYDETIPEDAEPTDVHIAVSLKYAKKVFQIAKYVHNYPHCWRTDKPVLYYPLEAWFIRTTSLKDRLIELNNTINWKPASTGSGRFGKWLENLVDWNLSRSRYWGTPLPVWMTEDKQEQKCIGSIAELKEEIEKSIKAGYMMENPLAAFIPGDNTQENYEKLDLHRPFVDEIILVSDSGKKMIRETDLIDVWFDSGAMPYAQWHYPFENEDIFNKLFPADFIAEGVDQTRGWFFTLHAIAVMVSDSVSFKNIISNGLVLDKNGNKMSKRLGNAVDPFQTIASFGADALRWYMITNAQPWDNLRFDIAGVDEVKRKFFGTLFNTYAFFALYANIDGFRNEQPPVPIQDRPEIDRWIISLLNTLVIETGAAYDDYEPTKAGRAIQDFVIENLSNWYVRLNRKRYWGGDFDKDKLSAYQTIYNSLETVAQLMAPIAPFFAERLFCDLNKVTGMLSTESVHHSDFPIADKTFIDKDLEERMAIAQKISSMVLGLRRKVNIKVRQPLQKIMIPVNDEGFRSKLEKVKDLVLSEVNVKEIEYLTDTSDIIVKKIKPNFKVLGPRYGKSMKIISGIISEMNQAEISEFEKKGVHLIQVDSKEVQLTLEDVEIISEDISGWLVANYGTLTVALDITITDDLRYEGIAREFINRIQNYRKECGLDVTDKILIEIQQHQAIDEAILKHREYICIQTLAKEIKLAEQLDKSSSKVVELDEDITTRLKITRID